MFTKYLLNLFEIFELNFCPNFYLKFRSLARIQAKVEVPLRNSVQVMTTNKIQI